MRKSQNPILSAGRTLTTTVTDNPVPFALAGVVLGLVWLLARERLRPKTNAQKLAAFADDTKDSIVGAGQSASKRLNQVAHDAAQEGRRLTHSAEHVFSEHPLMVGAGLLAVGTAVALAMRDMDGVTVDSSG